MMACHQQMRAPQKFSGVLFHMPVEEGEWKKDVGRSSQKRKEMQCALSTLCEKNSSLAFRSGCIVCVQFSAQPWEFAFHH